MDTTLLRLPAPEPKYLERDGITYMEPARVNHTYGSFCPVASFEEFSAWPEHHRNPPASPAQIDEASAARCIRLVKNLTSENPVIERQLREIERRLFILHPYCPF